jgi:hypothetical protein
LKGSSFHLTKRQRAHGDEKMKNKSIDGGRALVKAQMDAMSKHGYGKVYDMIGTAINVSDGDSAAAILWLAEKVAALSGQVDDLTSAMKPKSQMRKFPR